MRITTFLGMLFAVLLISNTASAWESKGWVKLGTREVNGKVDNDTIEVGKYDGRFSKLTLVVERDEMELLDFEVTFGNGEHWHPEVRQYFKEGARTRVIDLPGDERVIKSIHLKYKNIGKRGQAVVEVWGLKDEGHAGGGGGTWNASGWTALGEREVNGHGREDHDTIGVGKKDGTFARLAIVVLDNEIELTDMKVTFGDGETFHPELKQYFREGSRSREIDLPGKRRIIKTIDFTYRNVPDGKRAKVVVFGQ